MENFYNFIKILYLHSYKLHCINHTQLSSHVVKKMLKHFFPYNKNETWIIFNLSQYPYNFIVSY